MNFTDPSTLFCDSCIGSWSLGNKAIWQFVKFGWAENVASSSEESMSTSSFRGFGRRRSWRPQPVGSKSVWISPHKPDFLIWNFHVLHSYKLVKQSPANLSKQNQLAFSLSWVRCIWVSRISSSRRASRRRSKKAARSSWPRPRENEAEEPKSTSWADRDIRRYLISRRTWRDGFWGKLHETIIWIFNDIHGYLN